MFGQVVTTRLNRWSDLLINLVLLQITKKGFSAIASTKDLKLTYFVNYSV